MKYAKRMAGFETSEIREILKLTADPSIISFAGGLPASELFPIKEMEEVMIKVMEEHGESALQYSISEGNADLRDKIARRLSKTCGKVSKDQILITSGSQQGLDLTGKIFLDPGDVVMCESPSYLGALNAFKSYECAFIEVDTDQDGMVLEDLERKLKNTENVKLIYVIPDFQNPSGRTWSDERRKGLVDLAERYDLPIVEDNPYGDLCYEGQIRKPVKSYDKNGRVIYLGTFSKTFCPGLRLGWVYAREDLLANFIKCKQGADLHTNTLSQLELNQFMEDYDMDKHIANLVRVYKKRRDTMYAAMIDYFPEFAKFHKPSGGLFIWVELPEHFDAKKVFHKALEEKVAFVPGISFFPVNKHKNYMRMNFSCMDESHIKEGVKRLGNVLKALR